MSQLSGGCGGAVWCCPQPYCPQPCRSPLQLDLRLGAAGSHVSGSGLKRSHLSSPPCCGGTGMAGGELGMMLL